MKYRFYKVLLISLLLLTSGAMAEDVPAHLREAAKNLSRSYQIQYDETRKIELHLPEGYLVRREAKVGEDLILCPWNEFFIIDSIRTPAKAGSPIQDESAMMTELDALQKGHESQGSEVKARKVSMTAKGPVASFEVWTKSNKRTDVGSLLVYPVGTDLWILSLMGADSSLEDQKIIQNLLLEELRK